MTSINCVCMRLHCNTAHSWYKQQKKTNHAHMSVDGVSPIFFLLYPCIVLVCADLVDDRERAINALKQFKVFICCSILKHAFKQTICKSIV